MHSARLLAFISFLGGALYLPPAYGMDYPVECAGAAVDTEIDAAIAQTQNGPVRVLLSSGTCFIESTHTLNGAIAFSIVGAGTAATIVKGQGLAFPMFRVGVMAGGVDLRLEALTLQHAPNAVISMVFSALQVDAVEFSDNTTVTVIDAEFSNMTIAHSRFVGNHGDDSAIRAGGGSAYHLNVIDTTFVGNSTTNHNGGAISANASVVLDRVTFTGNTANNGYGGALYVSEIALTIRNSTFSGNSAAYGGAIAMNANYDSPGPTLRNVTMYGDTASTGGSEIYLGGSLPPPIAIFNSLVGGTCAGPAIVMTAHGSVESPGDTCGMAAMDNQIDVPDENLHLGPLSDNGGATPTLYPNAGSVLIDAAGIDCESVDQRDLVRNAGACDVGAVEAGATLTDDIFADNFAG